MQDRRGPPDNLQGGRAQTQRISQGDFDSPHLRNLPTGAVGVSPLVMHTQYDRNRPRRLRCVVRDCRSCVFPSVLPARSSYLCALPEVAVLEAHGVLVKAAGALRSSGPWQSSACSSSCSFATCLLQPMACSTLGSYESRLRPPRRRCA